ncbi:MAG: LysR family transcriptional regulator [Oribacterium sp.]|nr:LysR family transcriptional regulator [Oribacterium sp.]MDD6519856.1 LysR family transcriptional regulator [Oribacterium sp.]
MNILHYDYFIAIAENKTLTQAAHVLHVSQSVLSRYLQNLEADTGIRLFATASGTYQLTEAGSIYLQSARKIQLLQSQLQQKLYASHAQPNLLRFGIPPIRGGASLAYIYPYMLERYPSLHVSVTNEGSTLLHQKLLAGELDFILLMIEDMGDKKPLDFHFLPLEKKRILMGIPSFHALYVQGGTATAPSVLSIEDFTLMEDAPFVLPDDRTVIGRCVNHFLKSHQLQLNIQLQTSNRLTNHQLLMEGSYAGFVDEESAARISGLRYFTLPGLPALTEGMAFPLYHTLTDPERFFFYLEYQRLRQSGSRFLAPNEEVNQLLHAYDERRSS